MSIEVLTGEGLKGVDPRGIEWPADSFLAVERSNGRVAGLSALIQLPHIEGTWVDEERRGSPLAYRLLKRLEEFLKGEGKTHAFAFVSEQQPEVEDYLKRVGYKRMPVFVMLKEL